MRLLYIHAKVYFCYLFIKNMLMIKHTHYLLLFCAFLLGGCQSVEPLSIDYMLPAEISFPTNLRRVAVVNNMPPVPDNQMIIENREEQPKARTEVARKTGYFNGNARIALESLAETLADENYFDEVVICDSALRANDKVQRESTLSREEPEQWPEAWTWTS